MKLLLNDRIKHTPVALEWEDLSEVGSGKPWTGQKYHRTTLEEGIAHILTHRYNPQMHRLSKIVWEDGTFSWASWMHRGDRVYINSAAGSSMVTACLDQ